MTKQLTAAERKEHPVFSGVLRYFPDALMEIAKVSKKGNDQHNPGQPLHWSRGKSVDHEDALVRHLLDAGTIDMDGMRHSAKVAWRALAMLQTELENAKVEATQVEGPTPLLTKTKIMSEEEAYRMLDELDRQVLTKR